MKTTKLSMAVFGAVALLGLVTPTILTADEQPPGLQEKAAKQPFRGKIEALDTASSTLTVGGKVIYVAADTKIMKTGKTITLAELAVGDQVNGTTRQTFDGKTEAVMVNVTPQPPEK